MVLAAAKAGSWDTAYDAVPVPALVRASRPRDRIQLTPAEYARVVETTREVPDRRRGQGAANPRRRRPRRRAWSRLSSSPAARRETRPTASCSRCWGACSSRPASRFVSPAGGLVSEMLARIKAARPSLVCLGSLRVMPRATWRASARPVRRRRIVVGCWGLRRPSRKSAPISTWRGGRGRDLAGRCEERGAEARVAAERGHAAQPRTHPRPPGST